MAQSHFVIRGTGHRPNAQWQSIPLQVPCAIHEIGALLKTSENTPTIGKKPSKAFMYSFSVVYAPGGILARNQHPARE
jgi:hypothetical protein